MSSCEPTRVQTTAPSSDTQTYTLDALGNRVAHSRVSGAWTYDANNRLTQRGSGAGATSYQCDDTATEIYNVISFVLTESMMNHQTFSGKSTSVGNSKGFRFDAALFKANPEFFGEVRGTVLAPGQMLVSVVSKDEPGPDLQYEESNPVMQAFLSFLEGQMAAHPELIEPVTEAQMAHIAALVEGVEPD